MKKIIRLRLYGFLFCPSGQMSAKTRFVPRQFVQHWYFRLADKIEIKINLQNTGKKKLLLAGPWTEVCVALPALSAIEDGYEIYVVADASAGSSKQAHNMALQRMIQAGAKTVTWQAEMLEMQRDWTNKDTYPAVTTIIKEHGGTYGLGLEYANELIPQSNN